MRALIRCRIWLGPLLFVTFAGWGVDSTRLAAAPPSARAVLGPPVDHKPSSHTASYRSPSVAVARGQAPMETVPTLPHPTAMPVGTSRGLFADQAELTAEALVQQVLARNPSLAQMTAAYRAAQARYPQVTSLEDPIFGVTLGPATYGSNTLQEAYRVEISQKYPYHGKLRLRAENAQAEAAAAGNEVDDMRLRLVESAKTGLYDYYLVQRALEINSESLRLLREFRANAETRYRTGLVAQQDVLQAEVEVGREERRRLSLLRMQQVAVARLNTLLNLVPDAPLPPPPRTLPIEAPPPDAPTLRATALARRPDLLALGQRIRAEQAAVALAYKEYYPDFEPYFMYDRFMGNDTANRPLAYMAGLRMNLPVRAARRQGLVAEAQAKLAQRQAEYDRQVNDVNFQVQESYAQVQESRQSVALFEKTILPAAGQNIRAAQTAYLTGKIPFLSLIEAQRNLIGLRDQYFEAVSDYFRRLATLERVIGGPLDLTTPRLPSERSTPADPTK